LNFSSSGKEEFVAIVTERFPDMAWQKCIDNNDVTTWEGTEQIEQL